jgi:hypothetical protein
MLCPNDDNSDWRILNYFIGHAPKDKLKPSQSFSSPDHYEIVISCPCLVQYRLRDWTFFDHRREFDIGAIMAWLILLAPLYLITLIRYRAV